MFSMVKIKKFFLNQFYIFKFISNNKKIFLKINLIMKNISRTF